MNIKNRLLILIFAISSLSFRPGVEPGVVYLVIGSDTAIWEGMGTSTFHDTYNIDLYVNPTRNAYKVMDPTFRAQFVDSYGQPLKCTWWMMCGNIFRYATNTNMPIPNIMTMYLMQKYHGENVIVNGDELSLHYHTFKWTDYDQDGIFYWNQTPTFSECREDFDWTLAQLLIEENNFFVSFRSGWHYMDNGWQQYLNELMPFSMHNDYPAKRLTDPEPIDNIYDWSLASSEFIPFQPSIDNYQLPGEGPGWNLRSKHIGSYAIYSLMDGMFQKAINGTDQVACLWGHLPEVDFLDNLARIDSIAHEMESKYPGVKFRYCTAIEAMQRWLGTNDSIAPNINVTTADFGDDFEVNISSDERIFQKHPFVAVKDIYGRYFLADCVEAGINDWTATINLPKNEIAKISIALTDTVGNQTIEHIQLLPDDLYIDNLDAEYSEISGSWSTSTNCAWGTDSRTAQVSSNDSAIIKWNLQNSMSTIYNLFYQIPSLSNPPEKISFFLYDDDVCIDTINFATGLTSKKWNYITTNYITESGNDYVLVKYYGNTSGTTNAAADVIKISPLVRDIDLIINEEVVYLGEISIDDTIYYELPIFNAGISKLIINNISSKNGYLLSQDSLPISVAPMSGLKINLKFSFNELGYFTDTLIIQSNDPVQVETTLPIFVDVNLPIVFLDNDDLLNYFEFGNWHTSVVQVYGPSSRYVYLSDGPGKYAEFTTMLEQDGTYEIFEIVPTTVNSSNYALYSIFINDVLMDTVVIDQNLNSGNWVKLGQYYLPNFTPIKIRVMNTGRYTAGDVLRADAIKIQMLTEGVNIFDKKDKNIPSTFSLEQNYPNPFNPITIITYQMPVTSKVNLKIYDILGQEIITLVDEEKPPGVYKIDFNAGSLASGIYICQLRAGDFIQSRKMILMK
ncbi:MAG: T9SS type A sorting domain-containing protein [Ignavibacteriales bacterium]|nr:T9SS type A sorting domain-containing protein [Ignavibacteriales bacterium]